MSNKKDIIFNCEKYIKEIDNLKNDDISFTATAKTIENWRSMKTIPNDQEYKDLFYKLLNEENDIIEIGISELLSKINVKSDLSQNCKYVLNLLLNKCFYDCYIVFLNLRAKGYDETNRDNKKIAYYYNRMKIKFTNRLYYQPGRFVSLQMLVKAGEKLGFTRIKILNALNTLESKGLVCIEKYIIPNDYCEINNLRFTNEEYSIYKLNNVKLNEFVLCNSHN